jgi:hypothetical protein
VFFFFFKKKKKKKQHTPLQSCGTQLRAFFAVGKQHTIQVKPVEGAMPQQGSPAKL